MGALSGSGTVRTATFTPTANTDNTTTSITVAAGSYTDAAGNDGAAGATPTLSFDTKSPTLTITSSKSTLIVDETATITFTFSEDPGASFVANDITTTGGVLSNLSASGAVRTATFTPTANVSSGSASITVAANSYTDTAGNNGAAAPTPSISYSTVAPTVSGVAFAGENETTYSVLNAGDKITVAATFDVDVVITGSPRIALTVGSSTVYAAYDSSNAANTGTVKNFVYTVLAGDTDDNGAAIAANTLNLNGGTIRDTAGNNAVLAHAAVADDTGYKIDTSAPTLIAGANAVEANGGTVTLHYSEALDTINNQPAIADFTVSGHTVTAATVSGSNVVLTVTPAFAYESTPTPFTVTYNGGSHIHDLAGNAAANLGSQSGSNTTPSGPQPPSFTSTLTGVGKSAASAALDVTSNLVFTASTAVTKGTGNIKIVNDAGGTWWDGDTTYDDNGEPVLTGFRGENVISTQTIDVTSSKVSISADGLTITVDPGNDLDFANHYHIEIDAGAFQDASNVGNAAFNGFAFDTVVPMLVTTTASGAVATRYGKGGNTSQKFDSASNSLVDSYRWVDLQGRGDTANSDPKLNGHFDLSLLNGKFALVTADFDPLASPNTDANGDIFPGISVEDFTVALDKFGTDDLIYVDNLGRAEIGSLKELSAPSTSSAPVAVVPTTLADDGTDGAALFFPASLETGTNATSGGRIYLGFAGSTLGNRADATAIDTSNVTWNDLYDKGVVIYG